MSTVKSPDKDLVHSVECSVSAHTDASAVADCMLDTFLVPRGASVQIGNRPGTPLLPAFALPSAAASSVLAAPAVARCSAQENLERTDRVMDRLILPMKSTLMLEIDV